MPRIRVLFPQVIRNQDDVVHQPGSVGEDARIHFLQDISVRMIRFYQPGLVNVSGSERNTFDRLPFQFESVDDILHDRPSVFKDAGRRPSSCRQFFCMDNSVIWP